MMCWFLMGPSTFLVDQSTEAGRGRLGWRWWCLLERAGRGIERSSSSSEEEEAAAAASAAEAAASSSASVAYGKRSHSASFVATASTPKPSSSSAASAFRRAGSSPALSVWTGRSAMPLISRGSSGRGRANGGSSRNSSSWWSSSLFSKARSIAPRARGSTLEVQASNLALSPEDHLREQSRGPAGPPASVAVVDGSSMTGREKCAAQDRKAALGSAWLGGKEGRRKKRVCEVEVFACFFFRAKTKNEKKKMRERELANDDNRNSSKASPSEKKAPISHSAMLGSERMIVNSRGPRARRRQSGARQQQERRRNHLRRP